MFSEKYISTCQMEQFYNLICILSITNYEFFSDKGTKKIKNVSLVEKNDNKMDKHTEKIHHKVIKYQYIFVG